MCVYRSFRFERFHCVLHVVWETADHDLFNCYYVCDCVVCAYNRFQNSLNDGEKVSYFQKTTTSIVIVPKFKNDRRNLVFTVSMRVAIGISPRTEIYEGQYTCDKNDTN
jgi:hypothetical protein